MNPEPDDENVQHYIDDMFVLDAELKSVDDDKKTPEQLRVLDNNVVESFVHHCFDEPKDKLLEAYTPIPALSKSVSTPNVNSNDESEIRELIPDPIRNKDSQAPLDSVPNAAHQPTLSLNIPKLLLVESQGKIYGIDFQQVDEIVLLPDITDAPLLPDYILGFAQLRDAVLPIIDLSCCINGKRSELSRWSSVVVFNVDYEGVELKAGLLVDIVKNIQEVPGPVKPLNQNKLVWAVANVEEYVYLVLNLKLLFGTDAPAVFHASEAR